ncbi:putative toxin-antitoxin system toxin component, PIN family [Candidatus Poribacteria bacterium]|nr:putative toxin-antitoxin system toxin component, PIN family [Candidatus Poribacteria bacterium]
MVKVVIDTNLVASATIVSVGHSAPILDAWRAGKFQIVTSPQIIEEMKQVLFYKRIRKRSFMTEDEVLILLDSLEHSSIQTKGELQLKVVDADPADDKFIIAAIEGKTSYIVSGDQHLKDIGEYQGIKIISPTEFLKILGG